MIYDYIVKNYTNGEPIFLNELPGKSKDYIRQEMKRLTDEGKIERLYNGVYFLPYKTILGTKGKMSIDKYIEKKFLKSKDSTIGYITGIQFANLNGFTTQNSAVIEICTNQATTKQRKLEIDGIRFIIYQPVTQIDNTNVDELQFLDFMSNIDKYSELTKEELQLKLSKLIKNKNINFEVVKKYISLFPDRVFRNMYEGGLMYELV